MTTAEANSQGKIKEKFFSALGRRKTSIATIKLYPQGEGSLLVNGRDYCSFFPFKSWRDNLLAPFEAAGLKNKFNAQLKIVGGGQVAGSEACRLAIARALVKYDPQLKAVLRASGFLTRDPRAKERKKYGLKRARRSPEWSKR